MLLNKAEVGLETVSQLREDELALGLSLTVGGDGRGPQVEAPFLTTVALKR